MDEEQCICAGCVEDKYIRKLISTTGSTEFPCGYCNCDDPTVPLEDIADMVHTVLERDYTTSAESHYEGDNAESIIRMELGVEEEVATDIFQILYNKHNDPHDYGVYNDEREYVSIAATTREYDSTWTRLKTSLRTRTRFFNDELRAFLDGIFSRIGSIPAEAGSTVRQMNINHTLYRARLFEDYAELEEALKHPARNFGPPPTTSATSGRMNASGVPVFYGALSPKTAIAEVRPAVGNLIVVAAFRPLRPLNLLDLSALEQLKISGGSSFDPDIQRHKEVTSFLQTLSRKLTIPMFGKSRESEYLITQALAEYLSLLTKPGLDGIMFHSTQREEPEIKEDADHNVVLFSKSAFVLNSGPHDAQYSVNMYDFEEGIGSYPSPSLWPQAESAKAMKIFRGDRSSQEVATLEIDAGKLEIHTVKAVSFDTLSFPVYLSNGKKLRL